LALFTGVPCSPSFFSTEGFLRTPLLVPSFEGFFDKSFGPLDFLASVIEPYLSPYPAIDFFLFPGAGIDELILSVEDFLFSV